ncbi:MAG: DNA topoisomerase IB [Candidatus Saccharimonadaceae bacterium]
MAKSEAVVLPIELTPKQIAKIINDPVKTAKAVNLIHVCDSEVGILRQKWGQGFRYSLEGEKLTDKNHIERIKKLVIPPAWKDVWICTLDNGHLQVTGLDDKNRKQYIYHPVWIALRDQTKFYRMIQFAHALPDIRLNLEKDLALHGLKQRKVLSTVVSLMERTNIRVGNEVYEKLYGSYGITTLKDRHYKGNGTKLRFTFKGKKGVNHDITFTNRRLARIVQQCKEIPGKELFQYYDQEGNRQPIDSGMVNDYIKEISGHDFTAKDFRTWAGTVNAFLALNELGIAETETERKKLIVSALDRVASLLGNTRTVCRKYYVHPLILQLYETQSLKKYLKQLDNIEKNDKKTGLTNEEEVILTLLENERI